MEISPKDAPIVFKIVAYVGGVFSGAAVALYKIQDHGRRIAALENGKVSKAELDAIQEKNIEKFDVGTEEFREIKQLFKEFTADQNRRHDDLVKMFMENLRQ